MSGPYSIGSSKWNGLSKVIEECGEVAQVAGKLIGSNGSDRSKWKDIDLRERLSEELADLNAAIRYFCEKNELFITARTEAKYLSFLKWDEAQKTL